MNMLMSAAQQRQELIARVLAETAIKRLYRLVYRAIKRAAQGTGAGPVKYWSGKAFASCDPSQWPDDMELTVNVGLGTGNKDQAMEHLALIGSLQEKLLAMQGGRTDGPFVTAEHIAHAKAQREVKAFLIVRAWLKLLQQLLQVRRNEGLLQNRSSGAGQELMRRGAERIGGDESGARAQMRPVFGHPGIQGRSIQPGHPQVAQHDVIVALPQRRLRVLATGLHLDAIPQLPQHLRQQLADIRLVVDHQRRPHGRGKRARHAGCTVAVGLRRSVVGKRQTNDETGSFSIGWRQGE